MRHFYIGFLLVVIAVLGSAGFRGSFFQKPPIELFADMVRQPKLRPQAPSQFFTNQITTQPEVAGTIAQGKPREIVKQPVLSAGQPTYAYQDLPVNTGRVSGKTNYVELSPVPISGALLDLGQQQYDRYCALCHGPSGDGKGISTRYGVIPANFHDKRLIEMSDGQIFKTITAGGVNLMGPYGGLIPVEERWAIVAYVRALQRSQVATIEDVPEQVRPSLSK